MDGGVLLQTLLSGLAAGAVIGLVALGFSLVAGTVRVLHLAHGDVAVAAVFTGVVGVLGTTPVATALSPLPALGLVLLVLAGGAVLSAVIALLIVRPFLSSRGRPGNPLGWLAGGVAAGLLLREALGLLLPQQGYAVPDPLRLAAWSATGVVDLPLGATLPARVPVVLLLALAIGVATERLVVRSRFGRSVRAVADDPEAATLCGVPTDRVVLLVFVLAGLLAGAAGLLDAPGRTSLSVDDGVVLGLAGIAAALLGGLGSARGALLGGLAVGVLQATLVTVLDARVRDVVPLALLVLLLALRPEGLRRQPVLRA